MVYKNKVPQIRFKGFKEDWIINFETIRIISGNTYPLDAYGKNGILLIQGLNIYPNKLLLNNPVFISHKYLSDNDVLIKNEDILIGLNRPIISNKLKACLFTKDVGILYQRAGILDFDKSKIFNIFLYQYLFNPIFVKQLTLQLVGSDQPYIKSDLFNVTKNFFPSKLEEQIKIGDYFQQLDKLIEQKEKKYQKLKQFKKAMLDKMFPKNGADTPEIRFKGFNGKWEEKSLEEIVDRYDNLRIPISASNRIAGDTPYYGANGIQDYVQGFTHDGEFILVAEDGANDLKNYPVQYVNGKIWVNNHAHVLQAKKDISSNKFFKYSISKINIEPFLVGGGRAKLNANIMMKINIYVPLNLQEQEKIGNYFYKLDNQIDLQQKELEKLKNIKKASLAKMFI